MSMSIAKSELDNLKVKIKDVTEIACVLDNRQKRIIQTAQSINMSLRNSIEAELLSKRAYDDSQDKIKSLRSQIDTSNKSIASIKDKIKKIQDKIKPKE